MNQLHFLEQFDRDERRWKARHELIDQISACGRVKTLLHMLADFPQSIVDERGDTHVTVGILKMAGRLGRSRNTVRSYIDLACATPFLEILNPECDHDERTYVIHWLSIVDREPVDHAQQHAGSTADNASPQHAGSTADDERTGRIQEPRGGQISPRRGSNSRQEGVNLTGGAGQFDPPSLNTKDSLKPEEPVLQRDFYKEPVLKPVSQGGQIERGQSGKFLPPDLPRDNVAKWRMALATRDLSQALEVEELFRVAVRLGIVIESEIGRLNTFTQAVVDTRLVRSGKARTPKAVFRENMLYRRWSYRQDGDEDRAREMMRYADRHAPTNDAQTAKERLAEWAAEREKGSRAAEPLVLDSPVPA